MAQLSQGKQRNSRSALSIGTITEGCEEWTRSLWQHVRDKRRRFYHRRKSWPRIPKEARQSHCWEDSGIFSTLRPKTPLGLVEDPNVEKSEPGQDVQEQDGGGTAKFGPRTRHSRSKRSGTSDLRMSPRALQFVVRFCKDYAEVQNA